MTSAQTSGSRLARGHRFEDEVADYLEDHGVLVARNGLEQTHPEFSERLINNNSPEAMLVRFAPDGLMLSTTGRLYHWEAKDSQNLERHAYETYRLYASIGARVLLFVRHAGVVYYQRLESIRFLNSLDYVNRFQDPFDVEDDWIVGSNAGSGNPYRVVDLDSCVEVVDWNEKPPGVRGA